MLPFVGIFLAVYAWSIFSARARTKDGGRGVDARRQVAAALVFTAAFFLVLWPYVSTSKRVFGQYFYNVNSTFYVWYDDWAHASLGTYIHGDGVGWPTMPESELPSAGRYLREHTVGQIASRIVSGFEDMATKSVQMYEYLPYLLLYLLALLIVLSTRRAARRTAAAIEPAARRLSDPLRGRLPPGDRVLLPDIGHRHRPISARSPAAAVFCDFVPPLRGRRLRTLAGRSAERVSACATFISWCSSCSRWTWRSTSGRD